MDMVMKAKSALDILNDEQLKTIMNSLIKVVNMENNIQWSNIQMFEVLKKNLDDFSKD